MLDRMDDCGSKSGPDATASYQLLPWHSPPNSSGTSKSFFAPPFGLLVLFFKWQT